MNRVVYDPFTKAAVLVTGTSRRALSVPELVALVNQVPLPATLPKIELGDYVVGFGKHSGRKLSSIPRKDLISYCEYLASSSKAKGRELSDHAKELIQKAEAYLK